jgi:hypothetical protein
MDFPTSEIDPNVELEMAETCTQADLHEALLALEELRSIFDPHNDDQVFDGARTVLAKYPHRIEVNA